MMVSEHPEYNKDTNPYPSFGKKYNKEKGIISLTSWEKRIVTCSKTIYSLLKQCPGFHIVLVLSEEEFPKMMDELPDNLKLFVDNELIEVLWVFRNYKSFKKVLFTMDKYRDVPVISADDDCIYTCNYAQMLYNEWQKKKKEGVYYTNSTCGTGFGALFTPKCFKANPLSLLLNAVLRTNNDDVFYYELSKSINKMNKNIKTVIFHTTVEPISRSRTKNQNDFAHKICKKILEK